MSNPGLQTDKEMSDVMVKCLCTWIMLGQSSCRYQTRSLHYIDGGPRD